MGTRESIFGAGVCVLLGSHAWAQVTQRVSVASNGGPEDQFSMISSVSADGRCVAFLSLSANLVDGDTNQLEDIFVRDRQTGITERVSVSSREVQANGFSALPAISADGRFVVFESLATNLVPGDTNGVGDVFVRDRLSGTTERVSVDSNSVQGDQGGDYPSISADGRYVSFASFSTNLVVGDTNGTGDVFVRDRLSGTTERVSVDSAGAQVSESSWRPSRVSAAGRFVAFESSAATLVPGDTNGMWDIFVRDRQLGTTERVSVDSAGVQSNYHSRIPSISGDGRWVAFSSSATNLVPGDTNGVHDVFVRDRGTATTLRVSVDSSGAQVFAQSEWPCISADGRTVAFQSDAANLASPGDLDFLPDVFVHDLSNGLTERVSLGLGNTAADQGSRFPAVSADGRWVVFESDSTNLVPGSTNGTWHVYVFDRSGGPDFTSLCEPGVAGVSICPCSNPPAGSGRGCDNSSGTGGAILSASGGTFLSSDSLWFTTTDERPTALSIVTQWTGANPSGAIFGMGVRCTSGTLKRLYTKAASGGSITAPDFGAGDLQVSVRSAALGNTILPGDSRYYLVYYRDPNVLGGCPAGSTFNCTQTGLVTWSP